MTRLRTGAAALAIGAALCLSASEALAGFDRVSQDDAPDSWFVNISATLGSAGLNQPFNNIRALIGSPVTYTINAQTYVIANPTKFEDISSSGGHKAIQDFVIINPTSASTWAQTTISSTPTGTFLRADGNSFTTNGQILNFNLFFEGAQTDGTHIFFEFWNDDTFITGYEVKDVFVPGTAHPDGYERTNYSLGSQIVPVPSAAWMGGLALMGGVGGVALRRRRARRLLV